jgi:hypothetical protein
MGWFFVACKVGWYSSCTYDLAGLPTITLAMAGMGLAIHCITALIALTIGGVRRMRLLSVVALYGIAAFAFIWLWLVLTGSEPVHDYLQHALGLIPFLASGAAMGAVVWFFLGRGSNSTPHADARDVPPPADAAGARAGGRERYTA